MQRYQSSKIEKLLNETRDKGTQAKISIITITYNIIEAKRAKFFKQCINSIYSQSYQNIEHIIIDGGSNDGTVELLKKEAHKSKIISEPDNGIYDAFNKGLKYAQGQYIAFLNADDYYTSPKSIELSMDYLNLSDADFSYSKCYFTDDKGDVLNILDSKPELFFARMPFCHQTMICKKETIVKAGGFDTNYKLSADYDLIIKLILNGATSVEIPHIIANFRHGGMSSLNAELSRSECEDIIKKHFAAEDDNDELVHNILYHILIPKKLFEKLEKSNIDPYLKQSIKNYALQNGLNLGKYVLIDDETLLQKSAKKIKLLFIPFFKVKVLENTKEYYIFNKAKFFEIETASNKTNYKLFNLPVFSARNYGSEKAFYVFNVPIFKYYA